MRNLKKVLSLVLALMMVLSMMVTANAAFADGDKIDADYAEAVEVMNALGILQGSNGNFNPTGTLTRAEAAVILAKAHSGKADVKFFENETKYTENPFSDVSGWAVPYVLYCYENSITGGSSATTYSPKNALKGYEFAKMLLVAAGYGKHADYVGDANQTWQQKVLAKAKAVDLLAGLEIVLSENITREQASQMALNAMKAGGVTSTMYYVVAKDDTTAANTKPAKENILNATTDAMDAYFMVAILGTDNAKVHPVTTVEGGLLKDNFKTTCTPDTVDAYGRPGTTYTIDKAYTGNDYDTVMHFADEALGSYNTFTLSTAIGADLAGYYVVAGDDAYSVAFDTSVADIYYNVAINENGTGYGNVANTAITGTSINFNTFVMYLTYIDYNQVVEVYGDPTTKTITGVVVSKTLTNEITNVVDANAVTGTPAYAYIGESAFINMGGFKKGDVVSYTTANGVIDPTSVALATGAFQGVMTSYTVSGGVNYYTINGEVYELDGTAADQAGTVLGSQTYGDTLVYYPGEDGTIVYVDTLTAAAPTVYTDYALVIDSYVKRELGEGLLAGAASYEGQIEVLLATGATQVWDVEILRAASAIRNTTIVAGDYYYMIGNTAVEFTWDAEDSSLAGLEGNIYTYADKKLMAPVTDLGSATLDAKSGIVDGESDTDVDSKTLVIDIDGTDVYVNNETIIVMQHYNDAYAAAGYFSVVKGAAALGNSDLTGKLEVVASKTYTYSVKYGGSDTYVAQIIFATADQYKPAGAADTTNMVFATGTYTVSLDAYKRDVYTYTVYDVAGKAGTAEGAGTEGRGFYTVNTDGELVDNVLGTVIDDIVVKVVGTTVKMYYSGATYTVDSTTTIHDLAGYGLGNGSYVCGYDADDNGVIDLLYIYR